MEKENIIKLLNKALADEWLAFYQYWIGAKIVEGKMKEETIDELNEHAEDEYRHAGMLVKLILKYEGTPLISPYKWKEYTNCGYDEPSDPDTKVILQQNIKGERCAIETYKKLMEEIKEDNETYEIIKEIYEDEIEHEEDLKKIFDRI